MAIDGPSNVPIVHGNQDKQLNFLARAFQPCATQDLSSHILPLVPSGALVAPSNSVPANPTAAPLTTNTDVQPADDEEQDGSYGTLILGKGGRSKYLGPTAGSEWLKDVRCFYNSVARAESH